MDDAEGEEEDELDEGGGGCFLALQSCFGGCCGGRGREGADADGGAADGAIEKDDDHEHRWMDISVAVARLTQKVQAESVVLEELQKNGHFDKAIPQKQLVNAVRECLDNAKHLQQELQRMIEEAASASTPSSQADADLQVTSKVNLSTKRERGWVLTLTQARSACNSSMCSSLKNTKWLFDTTTAHHGMRIGTNQMLGAGQTLSLVVMPIRGLQCLRRKLQTLSKCTRRTFASDSRVVPGR